MNTKLIKKTALAVAILAGSSGAAQAGALGVSIVEIDNLLFSQGGVVLDKDTDFAFLDYTSDANTDVDLNSVFASDSAFANDGTPIDLYNCLGDCATYTDNDFTSTIISGVSGNPTSNYAIADTYEMGSPINGVGSFADGEGATLRNASQAGVVGDSEGSSSSNNGLQAAWSFSGVSGEIDITFDLNLYLETFTQIGDIAPTKATADYSIIFSICDNETTGCPNVWSTSLTGNRSSNSPSSNGNPRLIGGGWGVPIASTVTFTTDPLDADNEYSLTATVLTKVDVVSVPEPATLALLGVSLLGFGVARRRRAAV